jgi:hypothetical protein
VGVSPSTICRRFKDNPEFPRPFRLVPNGEHLLVDGRREDISQAESQPGRRRLTLPRMYGSPTPFERETLPGSIASAEFNKHMNCLARSRVARKLSRAPAAHPDANLECTCLEGGAP